IDAAALHVGVDGIPPYAGAVVRPLDESASLGTARVGRGIAAVPMPCRERLVVVLGVHKEAHVELLGVGQAGGLAGSGAGLRKDREENSRENRDDRNDDEQLDQGKPTRITS